MAARNPRIGINDDCRINGYSRLATVAEGSLGPTFMQNVGSASLGPPYDASTNIEPLDGTIPSRT